MTNYPMQITANGKTIGIDNTKAFGETIAVPFETITEIVNDSQNYGCGRAYIEQTGESISWCVIN